MFWIRGSTPHPQTAWCSITDGVLSGRQRPLPCQAIEDIGEEALVGASAGQEDPDAASADFDPDPSPDLEELEPDGLAASTGLRATLQAQAPEEVPDGQGTRALPRGVRSALLQPAALPPSRFRGAEWRFASKKAASEGSSRLLVGESKFDTDQETHTSPLPSRSRARNRRRWRGKAEGQDSS